MRPPGLPPRAVGTWCAVGAALAVACTGNGSAPTPQPPPAPPAPQRPCAAAAEQASAPEEIDAAPSTIRGVAKPTADRPRDPRINVLDTLSIHRTAAARGFIRPLSIAA